MPSRGLCVHNYKNLLKNFARVEHAAESAERVATKKEERATDPPDLIMPHSLYQLLSSRIFPNFLGKTELFSQLPHKYGVKASLVEATCQSPNVLIHIKNFCRCASQKSVTRTSFN
jgi:hypothetical protein